MNLLSTSEGQDGRGSLGTVHARILCDPFTSQQDGYGLDLSTAQQYSPQTTFLAYLQPSLDIQNIQQPSCCHHPQGWLMWHSPSTRAKIGQFMSYALIKKLSPLDIFRSTWCPSFSFTSLAELSKEKFIEVPMLAIISNLGPQNSSSLLAYLCQNSF